MKNAFFGILASFVLILTGCNSKSEKTSVHPNVNQYMQDEVGHDKADSFTITNLEIIQQEWEKRISGEGKAVTLKDFRIVKGMTTGDATQPYYILVATSNNGKLKIASLLNLNNGSFYFDTFKDIDGQFYSSIICEGNCNQGCDPTVTFYNGRRFLNCSICDNCVKKELEIR